MGRAIMRSIIIDIIATPMSTVSTVGRSEFTSWCLGPGATGLVSVFMRTRCIRTLSTPLSFAGLLTDMTATATTTRK